MIKKDILSLDIQQLEMVFDELSERKFRAKQVFSWLHRKRVFDFNEMTDLSKELRQKLSDNFTVQLPLAEKKLVSRKDGTIKYLFRLNDGMYVETVMMEYEYGTTICLSTQVGCKMGCRFCASAIAGYERDLMPSEVLGQIYAAENDSGRKISGIVLMGIGEPLDNYRNVMKAMELISSPEGTGLSLRHVTLSTCGVVPKIYELADRRTGITLSISLHCPDNEGRSEIMPINRTYNVNELIRAAEYYVRTTGRRVTFEYAVIDNVNSDKQSAGRLAQLIKGINCHVNLIPVNAVKERDYRSSRRSAERFREYLESMNINATVRRTLGSDIEAACGQLRRERKDESRGE